MYYYFFDKTNSFCSSTSPFKTPAAREISKEVYDKLAAAAQEVQEAGEKERLPYLIVELERQLKDLTAQIRELLKQVDLSKLNEIRKEIENARNN